MKALRLSFPRCLMFCVLCGAGFTVNLSYADTLLAITDIHFNPLHGLTKAQFQQLTEKPTWQWGDYFESLAQAPSQPGEDSNYALMATALDAAKREAPEASFVLYMGDFLAHDWQASYDKVARKSLRDDPEAYQEFTKNVLKMLALEFQKRFSDIPIFATLGNDDAFCADYWIQPSSEFNRHFAEIWLPLLKGTVEPKPFTESFHQFGAFTAELRGLSGQRLVVLNSVYWSSSYCDDYFKPDSRGCCQCENPGPLPGRKQIAWLEQELDLAKRENKRVWLVMHVPPGLDSYAEQKAGGKCLTASMWTPEFTTRYLEIVEKYESVLQVGFAGHTHMDDFRVTMHEGRPLLVHKLVPAVSPIFKNRPAFQIFQWDSARRVVQNWQTYQFDPVAQPKVGVSAWSEEYDARESYALEEMTGASVATLIEKATQPTGTAFARAYAQFYSVSASELAEKDLPVYFSAVLNPLYSDFAARLTKLQPGTTVQRGPQGQMRRPKNQ